MKNHTNGHSELSENPFLHLTRAQVERELAKRVRPGRPSKEVLQLRELRDIFDVEEIEKQEAPTRRRGAKHQARKTPEPIKIPTRAAPKRPEKVQIIIPPIETGLVHVRVAGMNSLIMHKWDEKSQRQIEEKQQGKAHKGRAIRDPKAEWNAARYFIRNKDCVPALSFKNAIVAAASFLPDVTKTLLKGAIFVTGDFLPIKFRGKQPIFRKDMVRIGGMSKTADVRYRPEYPDWTVDLEIEFDRSVISPEQVVNLVARAGFNVGVGEWRPTFGRFRVVRT